MDNLEPNAENSSEAPIEPPHERYLRPAAAVSAALVAMAAILHFQGRVWWCRFGDTALYIPQAWNSSHTSQHLFDPYTATHILHGVVLFWVLKITLPRLWVGWAIVLAVSAECVWELIENSNFVIEKYRANTASLDYFGDSIVNSVGDVFACFVGFTIAHKLGRWWSLAFFFAVELILLVTIRDGLLLNVIMLLHPIDGIKQWQMAM